MVLSAHALRRHVAKSKAGGKAQTLEILSNLGTPLRALEWRAAGASETTGEKLEGLSCSRTLKASPSRKQRLRFVTDAGCASQSDALSLESCWAPVRLNGDTAQVVRRDLLVFYVRGLLRGSVALPSCFVRVS